MATTRIMRRVEEATPHYPHGWRPSWTLKLSCGHTKSAQAFRSSQKWVALPQRLAACRECMKKYKETMTGFTTP